MRPLLPRLALPLALFLGASVARADTAAVRDHAELFTPKERADIDRKIADVRRTFHRKVVVETAQDKVIPKDVEEGLHKVHIVGHPQKAFAEWAAKMSRGALSEEDGSIDGVYFLIYRDPKNKFWAQVVTYPEEVYREVLPPDACEKLRRELLTRAHQKDVSLGQAVLGALDQLGEELRKTQPAPEASGTVGWTAILLTLGGFLVAWFLLELFRRKLQFHQERAAAAGGEARPSNGLSTDGPNAAVVGGVLGSLASHWVIDRALRPQPPNGGRPEADRGERRA
jgi:hypothetical protein